MSLKCSEEIAAFERRFFSKLQTILGQGGITDGKPSVAVAYSGGLDSSVLLHLVLRFCAAHSEYISAVTAIHIHHGLSSNADQWLQHCQAQCESLDVTFVAKHVAVTKKGQGIEAAARSQRYLAIGQVCHERELTVLLTAHHLDDQAETIMMQLLRGSGVRGLSGMDESNHAPDLLGNENLIMARPLLSEPRTLLEVYARYHAIDHVQDESNLDTAYSRNALRHELMPKLDLISPGYATRLARTADHMRATEELLSEIATDDLTRAKSPDGGLLLDSLSNFSEARINNVLRYWLIKNEVQLPSSAKLDEMRRQLFSARCDARIQVMHEDVMLSRYQDRLFLIKDHRKDRSNEDSGVVANLSWFGEARLELPEFHGTLCFDVSETGILKTNLVGKPLSCLRRPSGARLRLAKNRPSRDMKSHFQSAGIPFWRRDQLPFVYLEQRLLFVGVLGMDAAFLDEEQGEKISIRWEASQ